MLFLFLYLTFVEVCYLSFNGFDSRNLIDGAHVHGNDNGAVHIKKIRKHTVVQLRGENLQE